MISCNCARVHRRRWRPRDGNNLKDYLVSARNRRALLLTFRGASAAPHAAEGGGRTRLPAPALAAANAAAQFETTRHIAYPGTSDRGSDSIDTTRRNDMPLASLDPPTMQVYGVSVGRLCSTNGTTPDRTNPHAELPRA